jgi:hypothetical protein
MTPVVSNPGEAGSGAAVLRIPRIAPAVAEDPGPEGGVRPLRGAPGNFCVPWIVELLPCGTLRVVAAGIAGLFVLKAHGALAEERVWNQDRAREMVDTVLEAEATRKKPWNDIPWRADAAKAAIEAGKTGRPLLVFFYTEEPGPPLEPCCPAGRLMRVVSLSDARVQALVKRSFIPVKMRFDGEKGFPVDWPALRNWVPFFKFAAGPGFAGCSVVSSDLGAEYANTGSAFIWEIFDSTAYDPEKFVAMLERALLRAAEERALNGQRGITAAERKVEVARLRRGVRNAVRREGRFHLPPEGFSLEKALELFRMAGAREAP